MPKNNILCIELALVFAASSSAATLMVGKSTAGCPTAQYANITAAVNAAAPGDQIDICPALYPEQLVITKPLTLRGVNVQGIDRVLLQPSSLKAVGSLPFQAVVTVMNTRGVVIQNLAIDAGNNTVSGCNIALAGIHFYNASGTVDNNAVFGAQLANPQSCTSLLFGNGFGVQVDASQSEPQNVSIKNNSIHDFTSKGILVVGSGITAEIAGNSVSGKGPSVGVLQFGIFIANGAVGLVRSNVITEGNCGTLSNSDCFNVRSEGVTLRAVGDGTVIDRNIISNAQSGIFINGANRAQVSGNLITNIDALSGIDIQGSASGFFTNSLIDGNTISNVGPINQNCSVNEECCAINEYFGTGVSGNTIRNTIVNDAYCGVAHVAADHVESLTTYNTLYRELNSDLYPDSFPPATEPGPAIPGDVNNDGKVDCGDIAIIRAAFGKRTGQQGFDARADVNNDGVVDIRDLAFVSQKLPAGTTCPQ